MLSRKRGTASRWRLARVSTGDRDAVLRQIRWCTAVQTLVNWHCYLGYKFFIMHAGPDVMMIMTSALNALCWTMTSTQSCTSNLSLVDAGTSTPRFWHSPLVTLGCLQAQSKQPSVTSGECQNLGVDVPASTKLKFDVHDCVDVIVQHRAFSDRAYFHDRVPVYRVRVAKASSTWERSKVGRVHSAS